VRRVLEREGGVSLGVEGGGSRWERRAYLEDVSVLDAACATRCWT
jgi:hypothetical protein